jgi:DNA polymerase-3 subunit delta'
MAGPRMHHAWMLAGRKGLGKANFAMAAARELLAQDGTAESPLEHPDIHWLTNLPANRDEEKKRDEGKPYQLKRNITVEQVRAMQKRLTTRPTLGERRAVVIDPADDLEKGAANALLKSLEEPPAGCFFLLVAHRPGQLLPTIRSRCRILSFSPLSDEQLASVLAREAPQANEEQRHAAIAASAGSPGAALEFVEQDLGKLHRLMEQIAESGDRDFTLRGKLAAAMGARPDRRRQLAAVELARAVTARRMRGAGRAQIPALARTHSELVRLGAQAPTHNFDAGLLVMEIGTLLTSLAASREAANG